MRQPKCNRLIAAGAGLLLATAGAALAQERSGNVFVSITEAAGAPLPGVTVELSGGGAPQLMVTGAQGEARYLKLDPGRYQIKASLEGFSTVEYPNVVVNIGRNTSIEAQLSAAIKDVISVTAESPLLDERKLTTGIAISQVELEKIPTARDPWAILSQVAGVIVDQINVGGSESGQMSDFRAQGQTGRENDYMVDGVQITDMTAIGFAPTFFDFDQFEQIQLSTGGNDVTKTTGGVSVNLVTKRGTNEFRGSARFLLTRGDGYFGILEQADSGFDESDLGPEQPPFIANKINNIQDIGFEAGGPVWRDRVWLWASWGQSDIDNGAGGGGSDRTIQENTAIKLNAQISAANSFVGSFNNGDKLLFGRGANPTWDTSATWDQRGPTGISKFEDTHVFGSNFFLSGQYSFIDAGFQLKALGGSGPDQPATPAPGGETNTDANGFQTNNGSGGSSRPSEEIKIDGSYFFNTGNLSHELKFGGRTREVSTENAWSYPGRNIFHSNGDFAGVKNPALLASLGLPAARFQDAGLVYAYRQGPVPVITNYNSLWIQDTMTMGQWTFNVGFRYDNQDGENTAGTVGANIGFPTVMPALSFGGNDANGLEWTSISPRLGVTYALGEERRTLIRGSLSAYPDAMSTGDISRMNPVGGNLAFIVFLDDPGGFSDFYDDGEPWAVLGGGWGFNPDDPTALVTSNQNDPNMDPPLTNELILGVEHSFLPELVAGLSVTWRRKTDVRDFQPLFTDANGVDRTASAGEYVSGAPATGTLPDGSSFSTPTFFANPSLSYTGGTFLTNGDRDINYLGTAITFTKRLTNQWMLRGFVNYNFTEEWDVPSSFFNNNDPNFMQPGNTIGGRRDGSTFVIQSTGSGKTDNWMQSTWQWNLNGMYQVAPDRHWGFNVAANLSGREGYPIPYFVPVAGLDGVSRNIQAASSIENFRNDDIAVMDLRLEKEWRATGNTSLTFSIDGFNIFNDGAVLQRFDNLNAGNAAWVREVLSPRVWRLGVRLNWR